MMIIAVPGGTSPALGRSILTALLSHPTKITPIVLSRTTSPTPSWLTNLNIEVRKVDYTSENDLTRALRGVHTVICTLLIRDPTWTSTHLRLLTASLRANVQRFAPAEWGPGPLAAHNIPMFHPQLAVRDACRLARAQNAGFEFTCFHPGLFMNYLGYGSPNAQEALAGFDDNWQDIWWRVDEMRATIPLTREGKEPRCTMTEIRDVGRFVAEACLLAEGKWREDFSMVGETLGMDEVVRVVERVRGREMEVVYRGFDEVVEKKERELDAYRRFWWELEEMMARERVGEGVVEPVLNALCPDVRPMGVRKYVEKYWGQDV